jgi:arylsulfatase A-like enzyme
VDLAPTLYELAGVDPPSDLDGSSLTEVMGGGELPPRLAYAETGLWFTEAIDGLPPSSRIPYPGLSQLNEVDHVHGDEVVLRKEMFETTLVAKHRMVRDARSKLVYAPTRDGVRYLLFDTQEDPNETRDVSAERPAEVERLKGELWSWMLQDKNMTERGGFLVPRVASGGPAGDGDGKDTGEAIRVDAPVTPSGGSP